MKERGGRGLERDVEAEFRVTATGYRLPDRE